MCWGATRNLCSSCSESDERKLTLGKRDGNCQCQPDLVWIQNKRHVGVVLRILQIHLPNTPCCGMGTETDRKGGSQLNWRSSLPLTGESEAGHFALPQPCLLPQCWTLFPQCVQRSEPATPPSVPSVRHSITERENQVYIKVCRWVMLSERDPSIGEKELGLREIRFQKRGGSVGSWWRVGSWEMGPEKVPRHWEPAPWLLLEGLVHGAGIGSGDLETSEALILSLLKPSSQNLPSFHLFQATVSFATSWFLSAGWCYALCYLAWIPVTVHM